MNSDTKVKNHRGLIYVLSAYKKARLAEIGAKPSTKKNYTTYFNNLMGFISNRTEILVDEVDVEFGYEYRDYLASYIPSITHVSRGVEFLKAALEYAVDEDIIQKNPLRKFKPKRDEINEIIYITKEERRLFVKYKGKHQLYKDMFLLQCYTGMSFGDLWSYDIHTDKSGDWIFNKRNKNDKKYWVPLNSTAKEICLKYNQRFPYIGNGNYNDILNQIARDIGITKHLTSHIGRKTFATLMNQDGWSHESISDMMGITVHILIKHYINKSKMRIEAELKERAKRMAV